MQTRTLDSRLRSPLRSTPRPAGSASPNGDGRGRRRRAGQTSASHDGVGPILTSAAFQADAASNLITQIRRARSGCLTRSELSSVARSTTYGGWCTDCAQSSSTMPVWSARSGSDLRVCPPLRRADHGGDGASRSAAGLVTRGRARRVPDRQRGHQQCVDALRSSLPGDDHREPNTGSHSPMTGGHRPRGLQASGFGPSSSEPRNWAEPPPPAYRRRMGSECTTAAGRARTICP